MGRCNTETISDTYDIFNVGSMARIKDDRKKSRNVVLKLETYERLERYKVKLIGERKTSSITFDDAINELLNSVGDL